MPVTTQASGTLDKPYEDGPSSPTSFMSQDLRGAEGSNLSPNGSISSYSRTNSFDSLDGSNSSTSSNYGGGHSRQISNDSSASGADYIPTRSIKQASKPQHNPLQFVKVGSCSLYKKAEEQIKKCDEVKKLKVMVKQDEEDWQHNLDNWKSKRRLSSQKTLDRPDELQRFEEEQYKQKPRRKSKTFSEMVEERSKRGRNFGYFSDEWEDGDKNSCNGSDSPRHDLSLDSSCTGDVFQGNESDTSSVDKNHTESITEQKEQPSAVSGLNGSSEPTPEPLPVNGHENGTKDTSANEEYTFDKAIQSYVQYAESQKKTNREKKTANGDHTQLTKKSAEPVSPGSLPPKEESAPRMDKAPVSFSGERTGGTETTIIVKLKSSSERDFGFTTRSQSQGLVFVDTMSFRGSAEISGLKVDDEILAINGESVLNRSHSAIVFAIKQAVYTGQLELRIYRYDNAQQVLKQNLNGTAMKKPSRVEERKAVFSRDGSCEKELSPEKRVVMREQSPKVDIVKRRSLFESPPRDVDVQQQQQQHRHSVDTTSGWRTKAPSMDNLHTTNKLVDSNVDTSAPKQTIETKKINKKLDFKKKLASFENLEAAGKTPEPKPVSSERKQSLKDRIANFEKPEPFERSRSCDQLDFSAQNKPAQIVKPDKPDTLPGFKEQSDEIDGGDVYSCTNGMHHDAFFEELLGPPRIIDVMTKEDNSASLPEDSTFVPSDTASIKSNSVALPETKPEALDLPKQQQQQQSVAKAETPVIEEPIQKVAAAATPEAEAISNANDCMISLKSDFELADSLEETAFLGSSSPTTEKEPGNAAFVFNKAEESEFTEEPNLPAQSNTQPKIAYLNEISMEPEDEQFDLSNLGEELIVVDDFDFDAPPRFLEPPKEKPPPPPTETEMHPEHVEVNSSNLKRIDSTKRIKKELRRLRSDFLGIEAPTEQIILNLESAISPKLNSLPPKENAVANKPQKTASKKQDTERVPSNKTNEDDDLARKEQQIIEDLEREEQQKLAKLELKGSLTAMEENHSVPANEPKLVATPKPVIDESTPKVRVEEESKLHEREQQLRMQEELLRLEREKLRQEQEELRRQREEYIKQIQHHQATNSPPANNVSNRRDNLNENVDVSHRNSSENNAPAAPHSPPIRNDSRAPSATNGTASSPGELRRDDIIRLSRQPGLEMRRNSPAEENISRSQNGSEDLSHQAQKQVSARPPLKAKLTNGEKCIARRKQEPTQRDPSAYNQHWLIQEAEMRRINEQNGHLQQARSPTRDPAAAENVYSQQRTITSPNLSASHSRRQNKQGSASKDSVPHKNVVKKLPSEQHPVRSDPRKELEIPTPSPPPPPKTNSPPTNGESQMLSVSGKKKCSHCGDELGKGAAMIIESLHLFYHIHCFKCCVCHVQLGNGLSGADVRVRNHKLHCHNCYSNDEAGLKFSKV